VFGMAILVRGVSGVLSCIWDIRFCRVLFFSWFRMAVIRLEAY